MRSVFKHELNRYFHSISAYIFGAFLLLFVGCGALIYNLNESIANFEYVLGFVCIGFIILVPIITMRLIAQERAYKTDTLLYSLPISSWDIVLGKFAALMVVYGIPCLIIGLYPLIFAQFGDVYLPTSYGCLVAFYLLGLALMAIGMFTSSISESQGICAGVCAAYLIFNYYSTNLADYFSATAAGSLIGLIVLILLFALVVCFITKSTLLSVGTGAVLSLTAVVTYLINDTLFEGLLSEVVKTLSLFDRFYLFVNGLFDLNAIVYFVSVIAFFLFLCVQSLDKRRYN